MVKAVMSFSENLYQTLSSHGLSKAAIARESKKLLALKCYRDKILSLGKSAELSGLSLWDFIEYLGENNVPIIDFNEEQLAAELESVDKLRKAL